MNNKILLFDFDGTIADSFDNFLEIANSLASKYKFKLITNQDVPKFRSQDVRAIAKQLNIPIYKIPFIVRDLKKEQQKNISEIKPIYDLAGVLRKLKKVGFLLGILTSNAEQNVSAFLKEHNLEIFDYIQSDVSVFGKSAAIKKFLKQNKLKKENVIYVGDEIRDIEACKKVGIKIISVTWGFNSKAGLKKYKPDFIAGKPTDILQITRLDL